METTTLYLANGLTRVVQGDVGVIGSACANSDGLIGLRDLNGDTIAIDGRAVILAEAAGKTNKGAFGFARALEAS